ncbi:MAG TPA: helix-turn-helix domain-containing protein [Casimicrobiaceae bacterium]|nr:helix-turn-helix domain-containing protein [Casimicrobiaceae bacterium]
MPATMPNGHERPPVSGPIAAASLEPFPARIPFADPPGSPRLNVTCSRCALRGACVPGGLSPSELAEFERAVQVHTKRRIGSRRYLYRSGDAARALYALRSGFIKTSITIDDGREQVTGFHMMGDIVGLETLLGERHGSDAVALENAEVCEIPFAALDELCVDMPGLKRRLYQMVGREFQHERESRVLLGTMRAEERLASFLLELGQRYATRGYSAVRFLLRMSRADIGSYLGLRLETVSRLFSRFQTQGLLRVEHKSVEILDASALRFVIGRIVN